VNFPADLADHDVCRLITIGRRSGRRHDIEMWFGVIGTKIYFIAGGGESSDWFRNLKLDPAVEIRIGRHHRIGLAQVVANVDERQAVGTLMLGKYGHWGGDPEIRLTDHDWAFSVPAVAVDQWRFPDELNR